MAAIMAHSKMSPFELLENSHDLEGKEHLPFITIPTTSLDVFSLTSYFVAADPRERLVKLIASPPNLYAAVLVDSSLFQFLSGPNAAASLFEGLFAAAEGYCSNKSNFLSEALLERAINFYAKMLKSGVGGIDPATFAQATFLTSLGCAASSPGIGAALSIALSARFPVAKPAAAAALFPKIAEKLVSARPEKMARVAAFLGNTGAASVADAAGSAVENIKTSMAAMNVKTDLQEAGLGMDRITAAAEAARNLEFVSNSPWIVSEEDLFEIFKQIV
jgi:alcohol dehydrogenase class IV